MTAVDFLLLNLIYTEAEYVRSPVSLTSVARIFQVYQVTELFTQVLRDLLDAGHKTNRGRGDGPDRGGSADISVDQSVTHCVT